MFNICLYCAFIILWCVPLIKLITQFWPRWWVRLVYFLRNTFTTDPVEDDIDPRELDKDIELLNKNSQKLPTHDLHGSKQVVFTQLFGFHVPMSFKGVELRDEVEWTRENGSVYDASYKKQFRLVGKNSSKFLDRLVTSEIESLEVRKSVHTLMTNHNGGIIDDLLVSKLRNDKLHIVANTPKVLSEIQNHLKIFGGDISIEILEKQCYFIFQGPDSLTYLKPVFNEIEKLEDMDNAEAKCYINDDYLITRYSGTSEDGYTISCSKGDLLFNYIDSYIASQIHFLSHTAQECLRIEAGSCFPGIDFDENITPVEAQLSHLISERKKKDGGFPGSERILKELKNGPSKRRELFISEKGRLLRGDIVKSQDGEEIGYVTSATCSPYDKRIPFLAMGYINSSYSNKNGELLFGGRVNGKTNKLPFVPHRNDTNRITRGINEDILLDNFY